MSHQFSPIRAANEIAAALGHGCALRPRPEELLLVAREGEELYHGDITPSSRWGPTEAIWMTAAEVALAAAELIAWHVSQGDVDDDDPDPAAHPSGDGGWIVEIGQENDTCRLTRWVVLDRLPAMADPLASIATLTELAAAWERAADECDVGGGQRCVRWSVARDAVADAGRAVAACVRPVAVLEHTTGSGRLHVRVTPASVTLAVSAGGPDRDYVDPASVVSIEVPAEAVVVSDATAWPVVYRWASDSPQYIESSVEIPVRVEAGGPLRYRLTVGRYDPERRIALRVRFDADGAAVETLRPELLADRPDRAELILRLGRECPSLAGAFYLLTVDHPALAALDTLSQRRRAYDDARQAFTRACYALSPAVPVAAVDVAVGDNVQEAV